MSIKLRALGTGVTQLRTGQSNRARAFGQIIIAVRAGRIGYNDPSSIQEADHSPDEINIDIIMWGA